MNRVLHIATLVDDEMSYGGPVTVALNQCRELRRRGVDARLVAGWHGRVRLRSAWTACPYTSSRS